MPRTWYDRHSISSIEDEDERAFYRSIMADKKPYFMRYIYPDLMRQYNDYIKNTNINSLREFQMEVCELEKMRECDMTERQAEFLFYYHRGMPVGLGDCVMNKICRLFEERYDGFIKKRIKEEDFDYRIMKSDVGYTQHQYNEVLRVYNDYTRRLKSYAVFAQYERVDEEETSVTVSALRHEFKYNCDMICQNKYVLCDILLDICYNKSSTKRFVWDICGDVIIENLLSKNDMMIEYPTADEDGDIDFCGNRFRVESTWIGDRYDYIE